MISLESLKNNYFILVPLIGTISTVYFYVTGDAISYSQKQKLKSDSIRNGIFVSIVSMVLIMLNMYDSIPETEYFDSSIIE